MNIEKHSLKLLHSYLTSMSDMSRSTNKMVFGVIEGYFLERMKDENYFHAVKSFFEDDPEDDEIEVFYYIIVRHIIRQENLKEKLKENI